MIKVYVWQDVPNWGDLLGFELAKFFLPGKDLEMTDIASESDLITIGSTVSHLPADYKGVIAGTGALSGTRYYPAWRRLPDATVLGLRGHKTPLRTDEPVVYGDPGLIAPFIYRFAGVSQKHDIGIIPHWSDTVLRWDSRFRGEWDTYFINPFQPVWKVITDIRACKKLVTSSLHGMIIADAYQIPRRVVPARSMKYDGGLFKFEDYSSALGMEFEPEVLVKADKDKVEQVQSDILRYYKTLPTYFNDTKDN